ncbi:MAG: L-histidine N(alpha)-methyltransferase [Candidatus Cyclobacteriaceae bacterium M3_2C_046]
MNNYQIDYLNNQEQDTDLIKNDFAEDVRQGLSAFPKFLQSKYFYNKKGDELFQQIMHVEEYYLTDCEYEILEKHKEKMLQYFNSNSASSFDLVELGAGDGKKTKVLLQYFLQKQTDFEYMPVDISNNVLSLLSNDLNQKMPDLKVKCLCGDYFESLANLNLIDQKKKIILFLGSNMGNFTEPATHEFLQQLRQNLYQGDMVLIGLDLKKDPDTVLSAYNDPSGITRAFNLNLLDRINQELGGNFEISNFRHYPVYDPLSGEARSYLVSTTEQVVEIEALAMNFHFTAWEPIHMEISRKYDMQQIDNLASSNGFKIIDNFFDNRNYFVDSLWLVD